MGNNVRQVTSRAKFDSDLMSGRDTTWGATYTGTVTFLALFLYSSTELQPISVNQFSRTIAQNAVWCKEDPFGYEKCLILKCGGVLL